MCHSATATSEGQGKAMELQMLYWHINKGINNSNRNYRGHWQHNMWSQAQEVIKGQMDAGE